MGSSVKLRANLLLLRPLLPPKWPLELLTTERRAALGSLAAKLRACVRFARKHLTGTKSRSRRDDNLKIIRDHRGHVLNVRRSRIIPLFTSKS